MKIKDDSKNIKKISCNGGDKLSAHPLIYLDLTQKDHISCPYCGKVFSNKNK